MADVVAKLDVHAVIKPPVCSPHNDRFGLFPFRARFHHSDVLRGRDCSRESETTPKQLDTLRSSATCSLDNDVFPIRFFHALESGLASDRVDLVRDMT
jgi:hypothetical protein